MHKLTHKTTKAVFTGRSIKELSQNANISITTVYKLRKGDYESSEYRYSYIEQPTPVTFIAKPTLPWSVVYNIMQDLKQKRYKALNEVREAFKNTKILNTMLNAKKQELQEQPSHGMKFVWNPINDNYKQLQK